MSQPLTALRVWCTRPGRAGEQSCRRLHELGAITTHAPTLMIESHKPEPVLLAQVHQRALESVVALTSPASAANFVAACTAFRPDGQPWPVIAVGQRTALRARELGLQLLATAPRATAVELAPTVLRESDQPLVLLPGSNLQSPELGAALTEAGREVLHLQVQRTQPISGIPALAAERLGDLDLLVAFSPSALAFVESLDTAAVAAVSALPLAALGRTTGNAARALGLTVVVEPEAPGEDGLVAGIQNWWSRVRD
ncbi:hypothetical protein DRQ32_02485 [bacterium]|nr:MAG: hypothetical protein DRQ32_02485 [bacterium]